MTAKGIVAVTGASRGIGRTTARELASRGYRVFALARSESELQELAGEGKRLGWDVTPVVLDVADEESRKAAVDAIMGYTDGYGVDILVNSAGYGQMGPLEEVPPERLRRQMEVNVIGLLAFTQPFLAGMRERRRGWIVNLSSAAGRIATPFMGPYNMSKFALEGMSDALRLELSPFNVRVVLIEPGPIPTNFGRIAGEQTAMQPGSPYEPFYRRFGATHDTAGRFARSPETVARVIARAVESDRPRARYTITIPAKLANLGRLVPDRLRDWAYRIALGLH